MGINWTIDDIKEEVALGRHVSALIPKAMERLHKEVEEKVQKGQTRVVLWDDINKTHPRKLKISRIAMIPHKYRKYHGILNLSYMIQAKDKKIKLVNKATTKTSPKGPWTKSWGTYSITSSTHMPEQTLTGSSLQQKRTSRAVFGGALRRKGEWNITYIPPQAEGGPAKLIVPTSLQMGWIKNMGYFCTASEMGRYMTKNMFRWQLDPYHIPKS